MLDPATEECIAYAPEASRSQLDDAVAAARQAFPAWRDTPFERRQQALHALADRLEQHAEPFARLLTSEQGKPLADARGELGRCVHWLRTFAGMSLPVERFDDGAGHCFETSHVPIGVVAAIAPWNFPMTLSVWKVAPALLAGNTLVLKPSPFTPLTALKMGELFRSLLPPGVLNVISGTDRLGPWLTEHPGVDKIAFTGSTATGKRVMQSAAGRLARVTLELGGNDAAIVLPDVDVEANVPALFWGAFRNAAQFCLASKRMYVHESIYERFSQAFVAYARSVKEEAFGPVLPLLSYRDVDEVVRRANDSEYGLGASVWSADVEAARAVAERLECGTVWINHIHALSPMVAFGGHKQSGLGVENSLQGLLEYTNARTISLPA